MTTLTTMFGWYLRRQLMKEPTLIRAMEARTSARLRHPLRGKGEDGDGDRRPDGYTQLPGILYLPRGIDSP